MAENATHSTKKSKKSSKRNRLHANNRKKRNLIRKMLYKTSVVKVNNKISALRLRKNSIGGAKPLKPVPKIELSFGSMNINGIDEAVGLVVQEMLLKRGFDVSIQIVVCTAAEMDPIPK